VLKGIRYFRRNFTATAVKEHLRSQLEDTDGSPSLTQREVELVRFVLERPSGWETEVGSPASKGKEST
jgi:hypothetical protein